MAKMIQYDNFGTKVHHGIPTPDGPRVVLELTDKDSGEIHVFTYPVEDAKKVGGAMSGTSVVTAPGGVDLDTLAKRANGG